MLAALAAALAAFALLRPAPRPTPARPTAAASARAAKRAARVDAARAAEAARRAAPRPRMEVVARARWGSEPGAIGRNVPKEGAPEGPTSFAVDERGRMHVLDPVNGRITILDKDGPPRTISLPGPAYRDLALDGRGGAVVMDSQVTGTLAFVDASGQITHAVPLAGPGLPEPGGATGVFARDDGVWVEVEHRELVRVTDANGTPDPARPAVAGRFSRDGKRLLRAALAGPTTAVVTSTPVAGGPGFEARVEFALPVLGLHELASDDAGRVYLAAATIREDPETFDVVEEHEIVVVISDRGAEIGRVEIAPLDGPDDPLHSVRVGADGTIYELCLGDEGMTIERASR